MTAAGAGASAILAACGGGDDGDGTPGTSGSGKDAKPQRGGTITLSLESQLGNLHPQGLAGGSSEARDYVYDRLFNYDYQNSTFELSLASTLEQLDATNIIFKLSPQAKYQQLPPTNGRQLTSQDVVASWTYYRDSPRTGGAKTIWTVETERFETPDASTVRVVLKRPNAWAIGPHGLAGPIPSVVTTPELHAGDKMETTAVGAGAYQLEQFDPTSGISFTRRPGGWRGDRPYADKVSFKVKTDETVRAAAFRAKQIDALTARDKLQADDFMTYGPDMVIDKELGIPRMLWLRADKPPFSDIRVREAFYATLDIKELIDRVELGEGVYTSPVPAHLPTYALPDSELKAQFPVNRQKAQDLLRAAAFDINKEYEFKIPSNPTSILLAEVLQKQFAAVGVKTRIIPQDVRTVWAQTITNADIEIAVADTRNAGQDGNVWARVYSHRLTSAGTASRWSDDELDALIELEQGEIDAAKQKALLLQIERLAFKKFAPTILLYSPYKFLGRWSYYHSVRDRGYVGLLAHHHWTEKKA